MADVQHHQDLRASALRDAPHSPHLLIIDAQSLAGRAAHVAGGDVAAGVRLWCQMARGAALDVDATHVAAAWDHEGPTFRHALFPDYKRRRTGTMRSAITPIREGVEQTGIHSVSVPTFEGDDSAASLMACFRDSARVTLLSNDSDLLQFVADQVAVISYVGVGKGPNGMRVKPWSEAEVLARFGVLPANLPAFKALCGEDGDDIPGVKNVGKGTAAQLLRRWQTLEKALEASEFVSHRDATAKLAGQHEHARLMLQLTTIRQDVPLPAISLAQCVLTAVRWPDGSGARRASVVTHVAAGPGLEDVPFPDVRDAS
jgi:DNA polymerase-1